MARPSLVTDQQDLDLCCNPRQPERQSCSKCSSTIGGEGQGLQASDAAQAMRCECDCGEQVPREREGPAAGELQGLECTGAAALGAAALE